MTVTTIGNSIGYTGNGTTKAFAFPYIFFAPSDLVVRLIVTATRVNVTPVPVLNGAATYDYTVSGVVTHGEYASGGTVTFNTAPLSGHTVSLVRAVPAIQTVDLVDNAKFPADTVNTEFDYLTVLAQQGDARIANLSGTMLQIPSYEIGLIVTADPAAARANKLLLWDAVGNLTTLDVANIIGGSVPAGPAGGDLSGTYPNPTISRAGTFMAGGGGFTCDGTTKVIAFGTVITGNEGGSWNVANGRYTPPAGRYLITASAGCQAPAGGNGTWSLSFRKNAGSPIGGVSGTGSALFSVGLCATIILDMNGTDFVEVMGTGATGMNAQGGTVTASRISA